MGAGRNLHRPGRRRAGSRKQKRGERKTEADFSAEKEREGFGKKARAVE